MHRPRTPQHLDARHQAVFRLRRCGAVTVEFCLVISLFFLFLFASVEFARLNMIRHAADNAAYEAARVAIVPGQTATQVQNHATQYLTNLGIHTPMITVNPNPILDNTDEVTVTVSISMNSNSWVTPMFTSGATLTRSATLRTERYRGIATP